MTLARVGLGWRVGMGLVGVRPRLLDLRLRFPERFECFMKPLKVVCKCEIKRECSASAQWAHLQ